MMAALGVKQGGVATLSLLLLPSHFLLLQGIPGAAGIPVDEELRLTLKERQTLDVFKSRVITYLPHDYMKTDIYLVRWLRAKKLDMRQAEQMLIENLRWRHEYKIDTINDEDWTDMTEEFGFNYTINTHDKTGRPIGAANLGSWDMRRALLAGKGPRVLRFVYKCMEEITQQVIQLQRQGKRVTQWKALFNMDGFNFVNHACRLCFPIYLQMVTSHEEYYPGFADAIIAINVPPAIQVVSEPMLRLAGETTRRAVKMFRTNKSEWQKYLDLEISRDQRTSEYGGTRKD